MLIYSTGCRDKKFAFRTIYKNTLIQKKYCHVQHYKSCNGTSKYSISKAIWIILNFIIRSKSAVESIVNFYFEVARGKLLVLCQRNFKLR